MIKDNIFWTVVQGDRLGKLRVQLTDIDGNPLDLTLATGVTFSMRDKPAATFTGRFTDLTGTVRVNKQACQIITALTGIVEYAWAAGDLVAAGVCLAEFEITWPGALPQTVPQQRYMEITVRPQVA